jgi:hypothetical protein
MFNGMRKAAAPVEAAFKYLDDITGLYLELEIYIDETKKRLGIYLQDKSRINLKILLDNEKELFKKVNGYIQNDIEKLLSMESTRNAYDKLLPEYYALSESIGKKRNVLEGLRIQILNHERELPSLQRGIMPGNVAYKFPEKYEGFLLPVDRENITRSVNTATPPTASPPTASPVNAASVATMANVSPPVLSANQRNPKDILDQLFGEGSNTLEPTFKALLKEKRGPRGPLTDAFLLDAIEKTYERFQKDITDIGTNDEEFRTELKKKYVNLLTSDKLNSFGFVLHSFLRLQIIFNPNMYLKKPPANKKHRENEHSHTSNTPYYKKILLDDEFIGFCSMEQNMDVLQKILNFLEDPKNKLNPLTLSTYFSNLQTIVTIEFRQKILAIPSVKSFACSYIVKSGEIFLIGSLLKRMLSGFLKINVGKDCSSSGGARTRRVRRVRRTRNVPKVPRLRRTRNVRRTRNARKVSRI